MTEEEEAEEPPRQAHTANVHDTFVKAVFSRRENAVGLLEAALPPAVFAALDLETLEHRPGSFAGVTSCSAICESGDVTRPACFGSCARWQTCSTSLQTTIECCASGTF